jgi:hypothetical protein
MSETVVFIIGAIIFAITVYGTVMAGGLVLTRQELKENEELRDRVEGDELESGLPTNVQY